MASEVPWERRNYTSPGQITEGVCLGCLDWRPIEQLAQYYGRCSPECVEKVNARVEASGRAGW
ncbi:hypothetical protein [Sciscionella sediminilitoris]|uniref:hypothetical protein n=1 Tax=Sciscionella sediminilitoris TaxID=1445613 RepID=UPI0012E180AC|nr:hypothetical protein [Sciscionella sp. SE31]